MIRRALIAMLPLAALVGSIAGILSSVQSGRAVDDYDVYVNPGGSTNVLTCGFHVTCDATAYPDTNRTALDWGNSANASVYWRSFGFKGAGSQATIATGKIWNVTDTCKAVAVEVYSLANTYRGAEGYTHTILSGTDGRSFYIPGSASGAYKLEGPTGTTADSEISGCPWTAAHLHQFSDLSGWYRNSGVYPDEPSTGTGYDLTDVNNWQNRRPWAE
jgi:hypothetical protein